MVVTGFRLSQCVHKDFDWCGSEGPNEVGKMVSVVVDVDDTLMSTDRRMRDVWREVSDS